MIYRTQSYDFKPVSVLILLPTSLVSYVSCTTDDKIYLLHIKVFSLVVHSVAPAVRSTLVAKFSEWLEVKVSARLAFQTRHDLSVWNWTTSFPTDWFKDRR